MKKILIFMALTLSMLNLDAKTGNNKPEDLVLQGNFIKNKTVNYEVYMVMMDNSLELVDKGKAHKSYSINIGVGEYYIIKFIAKDGTTKYLHLDAFKPGEFQIDVDFNIPNSAKLVHNTKTNRYKVVPVPMTEIAYEQCKN